MLVALLLVFGRSSDRLSSIRQIGIGELNDKRALGVYLLIAFPRRAERTVFIWVASRKPSAIGLLTHRDQLQVYLTLWENRFDGVV